MDRGVRTVQRWATNQGLPVHRYAATDRSSVFAFEDEVQVWLRNRKRLAVKTVLPSGQPGNAQQPKSSFEANLRAKCAEPTVDLIIQAGILAAQARQLRKRARLLRNRNLV